MQPYTVSFCDVHSLVFKLSDKKQKKLIKDCLEVIYLQLNIITCEDHKDQLTDMTNDQFNVVFCNYFQLFSSRIRNLNMLPSIIKILI